MRNIYDIAHNLSDEIKKTDEYIQYRDARKMVIANPELKKKIEDFEKVRYDVQVLALEKGTANPEKVQKLQELYTILVENKDIKDYFDLEVKFNVMMADINKIIAESMEEILNI